MAAILGTNERFLCKLHPHAFSFFRYYGIGILLLIWTIVMTWLFYWGYLKDFESIDWFGEGLNPMLPALLWFLVAAPIAWRQAFSSLNFARLRAQVVLVVAEVAGRMPRPDLEDLVRKLVEEIPVVRHQNDGPGIMPQRLEDLRCGPRVPLGARPQP